MRPPPLVSPCAAVVLALALAACAGDKPPGDAAPLDCPLATAEALGACVEATAAAHVACLESGGGLCAPDAGALGAAAGDLSAAVDAACAADASAAEVEALQASCALQAESLVGRVAGGPQAAVWASADAIGQACVASAVTASAEQLAAEVGAIAACAADGACDAAALPGRRAAPAGDAVAAVEAACADLPALTAQSPASLGAMVSAQAECVFALGAPEATDLGLRCGPSASIITAAPGEWTQVVLPSDLWGTRCADGTDYAFWIRPAPAGAPPDRILIGLEGGGVCVFGEDCAARAASSPYLFSALDNTAPEAPGVGSLDPAESAFAEWTHVFLPYCTQDVFAGGGVDEDLGEIVVPRYGAVNARAAIRAVRDWVWATVEADPSRAPGYRPDGVQVIFGGWSAGSYGTLYNYAWVLDELGWPRTTAFPDGGLAIDNREALGVRALGAVKIPAWGTLPFLPSYCFAGDCALGEEMARAISPRLLRYPEQQLLMLSHQVDDIQAGDAYFSDRASFVNALRRTYCDTQGLPGVAWYLSASADESVHCISPRTEWWSGEVAGVRLADWLADAAAGVPVSSVAAEGGVADAVPGVEPFACALP